MGYTSAAAHSADPTEVSRFAAAAALPGVEALSRRRQREASPVHFHDGFVFSLVLEGVECMEVGGQRVYTERGGLSLAHPREVHANPLAGAHTAVSFDSVYVPCGVLDAHAPAGAPPSEAWRFGGWRLHEFATHVAFRRLHAAVWDRDTDRGGGTAAMRAFAVALLAERSPATPAPDPLSAEALAAVVAHVETHLSERIAVADLAALAGTSQTAFAKTFRARTGLPPHHYILLRRVLAAKAAIAGGNTLTQAAYRCGFTDLQHLTRTFRRFVGVTPGAFRAGVG